MGTRLQVQLIQGVHIIIIILMISYAMPVQLQCPWLSEMLPVMSPAEFSLKSLLPNCTCNQKKQQTLYAVHVVSLVPSLVSPGFQNLGVGKAGYEATRSTVMYMQSGVSAHMKCLCQTKIGSRKAPTYSTVAILSKRVILTFGGKSTVGIEDTDTLRQLVTTLRSLLYGQLETPVTRCVYLGRHTETTRDHTEITTVRTA